MGNYTLSINLLTQTLDPVDQNIALERIKYFLSDVMHSTIFINQMDADRAEAYAELGFSVTTLPEEPVDQVVGIMLFHKLNAIMEGRMKVTELAFCSDTGDNVEYFHTENEHTDLFPATGWWNESGLKHSDVIFEEDIPEDIKSEWQELELGWNHTEVTTDLGKVVFANFGHSDNETKH
jgi:hypothetical protein